MCHYGQKIPIFSPKNLRVSLEMDAENKVLFDKCFFLHKTKTQKNKNKCIFMFYYLGFYKKRRI